LSRAQSVQEKFLPPRIRAKNFLGFTLDEPVYICYALAGKEGKSSPCPFLKAYADPQKYTLPAIEGKRGIFVVLPAIS